LCGGAAAPIIVVNQPIRSLPPMRHLPVSPAFVADLGHALRVALPLTLLLATLAPLRTAAAQEAAGRLLVVNKGEATLSVVDPVAGTELARIATGVGPHEVAVSPDGRTAVVTNYGPRANGSTLTVVDLDRLEAVATIDLGEQRGPHGIAWFPDGRRVAVTTEGTGTLSIVDVAARRLEAAIPTGARVSHEVALSADGARAFVANIGSGSVTVIDVAARQVLRSVATGAGAEGVAVRPDGREAWVSNRAANTVTVLDAASLEVLAELPSADFPIRVAFTPDGRRALVTNARSAELRVFDVPGRRAVATVPIRAPVVEAGQQVLAFEGSALPIGVLADPDNRHVYVAAASADVVAVVDLERGAVVRLIAVGREPDGLAWAPAP
jgi:YVTN family beta-propeller protein